MLPRDLLSIKEPGVLSSCIELLTTSLTLQLRVARIFKREKAYWGK